MTLAEFYDFYITRGSSFGVLEMEQLQNRYLAELAGKAWFNQKQAGKVVGDLNDYEAAFQNREKERVAALQEADAAFMASVKEKKPQLLRQLSLMQNLLQNN